MNITCGSNCFQLCKGNLSNKGGLFAGAWLFLFIFYSSCVSQLGRRHPPAIWWKMASNSDAISPGTIAQGRKCLNRDLYVLFIDYEISGGPTHEGNFKSCVRFGLRWRVTGKGYTINRGVASKRSGYARLGLRIVLPPRNTFI